MPPTHFLVRWCCCMLVLFAVPGWAATDSATAEALMRKSGLWAQLADIAPLMRAQVLATQSQAGRSPSVTEAERLSRAVDTVYSARRLRSACVAHMARELAPAHLAALSRWYDAPKGRAITALEQEFSRQADSRAFLERGAALLGNMPASRRGVIDEIILATGAAELATELHIGTAIATRQGTASVSPDAPGPSASELKAALDGQRQQLIRIYSALSRSQFAAGYSSLSTDDLKAYLEFLKSDAGRHYSAVSTRAYGAAMVKAANEFGRSLPGARDKAHT